MSNLHKYRFTWIILLLTALLMAAPLQAWNWQIDPDIPGYDARWQQLAEMNASRVEGKNIDDMLALAHILEKDYPDKVDPYLWLARLYFIKAKFKKKNNLELYKKSEEYAVKAHQIDPDNVIAFKILIDTLPNIGDLEYSLSNHGAWIKQMAPLPSGYAVPLIKDSAEFNAALNLWNQRLDIEKGKQAVEKFNALADSNPDNPLALAWACRANYDIGQYLSSLGEHETKAMPYYQKGLEYGNKALAIDPYHEQAAYWTLLNQARIIQMESLLTKAQYIGTLVKYGVFGIRENGLYNYYGISLALATMITNGGWVTEKGMNLAGISFDTVINQLELARIIYPDKFYVLYGLADIHLYKGNNAEAQKLIDELLTKDPMANEYLRLENSACINFARDLRKQTES